MVPVSAYPITHVIGVKLHALKCVTHQYLSLVNQEREVIMFTFGFLFGLIFAIAFSVLLSCKEDS